MRSFGFSTMVTCFLRVPPFVVELVSLEGFLRALTVMLFAGLGFAWVGEEASKALIRA